ncbi:RIO kinase 2, partial [Tremellales sp. Uapishka_1]
MKLDATDLRYITSEEFRVLTAVEIGSKNHEVVPSALIAEISDLRGGNVNKMMGQLAKRGLIARVQNAKYDGFRLTYGGLDYLALRTFSRRTPPSVHSVGKQIGVGKESDIYIVADENGEQRVLKIQRLGRISFRAIKSKRDYLGKRKSASWMYMSRLAAQKEWAFMKVLYNNGFPVPIPIDQARHCVVMSHIDSYPLRQVAEVESPGDLYSTLMSLIVRLAHSGLIHGDFNEFNILIGRKDGEATLIDFPQMVSTRHENAEYFFNRDVNCIRKFFRKRFRYESKSWPTWREVMADEAEFERKEKELSSVVEEDEGGEGDGAGEGDKESKEEVESQGESSKRVRLDLEVEASGFGRSLQRELEDYMIEVQDLPASDAEDDSDEDEEEEEVEEEPEPEVESTAKETRSYPSKDGEFDEEAFQKQVADRMEALRLSKALGNDDPDEEDEEDSDAFSDSESDAGSDVSDKSDKPPPSDYTSFTPGSRSSKRYHPRASVKKLQDVDEVKSVVAAQVGRERERTEKKHHTRKSGSAVGNTKGHKWKKNGNYLVGKSGGGDGWQ